MRAEGFKRLTSMAFAIALLVGAGIVATGATRPAQAATNLDIFVGYADDTRASAISFPTPWSGAPNTVFIGSAAPWDAGAIRLVNPSASPVLVDGVSVDLHHGTAGASGPVFNPWGTFTIPANSQAILTQTTQYNFDTSDPGFQPCGIAASATDPRIPTVTVTVGGSPTIGRDTGHVLDTFGYDSACLGNESIQWSRIGSAACVGSSLTLAPPSQSAVVGGTATVNATFTNSCGAALANVGVNFKVDSGPNAGRTGAAVTDAAGHASFTYSGAAPGTDALHASVTNPIGTITSNTVTVTWTDPPIAAFGQTISATEGISFSGAVATFTDPDPMSTAAEYRASIDWGDTTATPVATISGPTGGPFTVSGTHTYAEEGPPPRTVLVTITDNDNPSNTGTATSSANVADAALTGQAVCPATISPSFTGPIATFTDSNPGAHLDDFTATVNWGDGTTSAGTISGGNPYTVTGSHVYHVGGLHTITTTIHDKGGRTITVRCPGVDVSCDQTGDFQGDFQCGSTDGRCDKRNRDF